MGLSPHRRPASRHRSGSRSRRLARLLFERLEDRLALAASPAISISDVILVEGNAGATAATFTVSLSKASNKRVSVDYATLNGTAVAGADFDAVQGTLTFARGQVSRTITVPIQGDTLDEPLEYFFIRLSDPSSKTTIRKNLGVGIIVDDDTPPTIAVSDVNVAEGVSGTGTGFATFDVALSAPSSRAVTVNYSTANDLALAGSDYSPTTGTLTFAPGQTHQSVAVPLLDDLLNERDETFFLNLSTPQNAVIADPQGVGTITDDDPVPTLTIGDSVATEGENGGGVATFEVKLSAPSSQPVAVEYSVLNGTARAEIDYTPIHGIITFAPGQTSQTVAVSLLDDALDELDETFFVNLSNPRNAEITDDQGIGTIVDDDPTPTLSVSDTTVTESETDAVFATLSVTLSAPSALPVIVNVSTANGTASLDRDYIPISRTLTFAPGQTTLPVIVPIVRDPLDEADETILVNLSDPLNAAIADAQGIVTIVDNDATPSLVINDRNLAEIQGGSTPMIFLVTLSAPSGQVVTVNYSTAEGSATAEVDYTPTTGTLTFAPGQTSQTVAVPLLNDQLDEENETFFLNLSEASNAAIADSQGLGTILDDDAAPFLAINNVSLPEGNTGFQEFTFTVNLNAPSGRVVTVAYTTTNGTATAGDDFTETSGTLTFLPGTTSQTITVPIVGETLFELNENFFVQLSAPANAQLQGPGRGVGVIVNDDATPTLTISDASVTEGDVETTTALFTVTLSAPSGQIVVIGYDTFDGLAKAGLDYTAISGSLTFLPGQTSQTISVPILGDLEDEPNETFSVRLRSPLNVTITDGQGIGRILDNDPAPSFSISDATVVEGGATHPSFAVFTVTLSFPTAQLTGFSFNTASGSAWGGIDFGGVSGSFTFLPGQTTQTISVPILDDSLVEADETFFVRLSNVQNATLADGEGVGTILDNDFIPAVSVGDTTVTEGDGGPSSMVFTVTLSAASNRVVTVHYTTADSPAGSPAGITALAATAAGAAAAGSDYEFTSGTLTFLPGETSHTISVPILDDPTDEAEDSFFLRLVSAVNATIADGQAVGTIVDDDPTPSLTINNPGVYEGNPGDANTVPFLVTLSAASEQIVTVSYTTSDGSALAGSDYTTTTGTLTFLPGETTQTIDVPVLSDSTDEPDKSFAVQLESAVNATIVAGEEVGVGTIYNDDPTPNLSFRIEDAQIVEGDSGAQFLVFRVLLSGPSNNLEWAVFTTSDGTATAADSDYTPQLTGNGITFLAGVTERTVSIPILGDTTAEPDEVFYVNLIRASQTISDDQAVGTIVDDDSTEA